VSGQLSLGILRVEVRGQSLGDAPLEVWYVGREKMDGGWCQVGNMT